MKKIILLLSCVIVIASMSHAQDSTSKKTKHLQNADSTHRPNMKENLKDLDLTADQQKKIEEIHSNGKKEKDKIKADNALTEDQKQEKMKAIEKDSKTKIGALLTPAQKEKLKSKKTKPSGQ